MTHQVGTLPTVMTVDTTNRPSTDSEEHFCYCFGENGQKARKCRNRDNQNKMI